MSAWRTRDFQAVDQLLDAVSDIDRQDGFLACRGQSDASWATLKPTLYRSSAEGVDYSKLLDDEQSVISRFCEKATRFVGRLEEEYLQGANIDDRIAALTVIQHHGAPTRLLDWTRSVWIGLYFAVIQNDDKDGALWYFKQGPFEAEVDRRWATYGLKHGPRGQVNLNETAFTPDGPNWITKLHCPIPFERIEAQQGLFTVAGRLGSDHRVLIADILNDDSPCVFLIRREQKKPVLERLRRMNIHAVSLRYPGADIAGLRLASEFSRAV